MDPVLNTTQMLRAILTSEGIRAALIYLNGLSNYRFTSLYRFDRDTLSNLYFFDRENPQVLSTDSIPVLASYCVFVRERATPFLVADSLKDERIGGHEARPVIRSYCGVPMVDESGSMFGSVCHYDYDPRASDGSELHLLEVVAPMLMESRERD